MDPVDVWLKAAAACLMLQGGFAMHNACHCEHAGVVFGSNEITNQN